MDEATWKLSQARPSLLVWMNQPWKGQGGCRSKGRALVIPQGCFSVAVGLHPLETQLFFWSHFWVLGLSFTGAHKVFCRMWHIGVCVLVGSAEVTINWALLAAQRSGHRYWCWLEGSSGHLVCLYIRILCW